jgi:hypothetical protein
MTAEMMRGVLQVTGTMKTACGERLPVGAASVFVHQRVIRKEKAALQRCVGGDSEEHRTIKNNNGCTTCSSTAQEELSFE